MWRMLRNDAPAERTADPGIACSIECFLRLIAIAPAGDSGIP
jgi:hypothetical protein